MKKIATKFHKRLQKDKARKVLELDQWKQSKQAAEQAIESIKSVEQLLDQGYHPVYSAYANAQNLLSVIIEGLLLYSELDRFARTLEAAEELYMPGGPPMSPVTNSYFYSWACADLTLGLQKESLISVICDTSKAFKLPPTLVDVFRVFEQSTMGVYLHEGVDGDDVLLKELQTSKRYKAFNQSGYAGQAGELWFVRLLPNLTTSANDSICFTTPYVLRDAEESWQAFIHRESWKSQKKALTYDRLLKTGMTPTYWLEFITQAYCGINNSGTAIFLQGVPDQSSTRPHADVDASGARLPDHAASVSSLGD